MYSSSPNRSLYVITCHRSCFCPRNELRHRCFPSPITSRSILVLACRLIHLDPFDQQVYILNRLLFEIVHGFVSFDRNRRGVRRSLSLFPFRLPGKNGKVLIRGHEG
jgi:hypothetical protein